MHAFETEAVPRAVERKQPERRERRVRAARPIEAGLARTRGADEIDLRYGLFREGSISSGVAARWLGVPRAHFPMDAMRHGATLLDDSDDDFRRETSLT